MCAVYLIVLLLFVGLAVDFGLAYVTKANLGKAVDAAVLTGARYSAQGQTQSSALAQSSFAMNYGNSGRDTAPPVVNVAFSTNANGNTVINVSAIATIRTFFIGLLPGYNTLNVSAAAQSVANKVEMTLVLDRSGSMSSDGGAANLPNAVKNFIAYFNDSTDSVALITFSNTPKTVISMTTGNFKQSVTNGVDSINWGGNTFSDAALQQAFTQELQPVTGNVTKVVVFFTDGGANTIQNNMTCTGAGLASGLWNFGGQDPPSTDVSFIDPTSATGNVKCNFSRGNCCNNPGTFPSASLAGSVAPAWTAAGPAVTPWSTGGVTTNINFNTVQADAIYRAEGDATAMRKQGITVYSIGLGSAPAAADPTFLCTIANDPTCPTYDPTLPAGVYQGAATGADLDAAFQAIASIIRLRLTQ
jgi:Flp pilus assembly protein TadG